MNDWKQTIPEAAVVPLYRHAKMVVNVQRDDCPELYNLRCFEAFAAGALLLTEIPNLLGHAGFKEGVHYAGYGSDADLFAKLDFFLANETARAEIAETARDLSRRSHTYDQRVAELFSVVSEVRRTKKQQHRSLSTAQRNYLYCHYYSKRLDFRSLSRHLRVLVRSGSPLAVPALAHCSGALWHQWRNAFSLRPDMSCEF